VTYSSDNFNNAPPLPKAPGGRRLQGATYNKEGKHTEAVKQLTRAVKIRPKMEAAHMELGIAYAALGVTPPTPRRKSAS